MTKTKKNYLFLLIVLFSIYCVVSIGQAWDEGFLLLQGEIAIKYLLSLGRIDQDLFFREYYSPIYYVDLIQSPKSPYIPNFGENYT